MNEIANRLARFDKTTLEALDVIKLLKRYDTKFIFCRDKLIPVFEFLSAHYEVLEIDDRRYFRYESLYYDTDDFFFYRQHHNKKYDRYKVRYRKYLDSNRCYFEVKHKNNKNKTIKNRILLDDGSNFAELSEEAKSFARKSIASNWDVVEKIKPKLGVNYERITFANHKHTERLTIDLNLGFTNRNSKTRKIENLVIAELKSEQGSSSTKLVQHLKGLKIYPVAFSKYCIGIALTEKNVKNNCFKNKLLKLNRLNWENSEKC